MPKLDDKKRELLDFQSETIKVIRGESKLSMELLNTMIDRCSNEIEEISANLNAVQKELDELQPVRSRNGKSLPKSAPGLTFMTVALLRPRR